jgi:gliding motility-associated-like protein
VPFNLSVEISSNFFYIFAIKRCHGNHCASPNLVNMRFFILCLCFLFSASAIGQYAYIPNRNSATTSVINISSNTVIATLPMGIQPQGVAVSEVRGRAYIANNGSNSITVINTCDQSIVATINGLVGIPAGIAVSPDGQRLYVPNFATNLLQVIDLNTNAIVASIVVGAGAITAPEQCVVSPDNSRVYLTLFDENKLAVVNAATNTVITYYATDDRPTGVDILNDGTKLYVANQNSNTLIVYNTATGTRISTINLGPTTLINGGAAGVVLNHANTLAYVALQDPNTVKVVNTTTNTVTATVGVGGRPFGLDITPDDSRLYVSCVSGNRVDVVSTLTNTNILNIPVGQAPYSYGKFIIRKSIDSVKINKSLAVCNTYNFQGLAFFTGSAITSWQWYFGDGGTSNTQNTSHSFGIGTYTVKLVVTNANGCKDSTTTVIPPPVNGVEAGNDSLVCPSIPFILNAQGAGITSWSWSPGGVLSNPGIQNPIATISTNTKFYITVTTASGCNYTDSVSYSVDGAKVDVPVDTDICAGASTLLTATGVSTYSWSPVTGLSNPLISNPVAAPLITTKYYVTGNTAIGCSSTDSVLVTVKPLPNVDTRPDTTICAGTSVQLNTTGAISYSWTPVTGLSNPAIANPVATPLADTKYFVTGTGVNGCFKTDSVMVTLKLLPVVDTRPDTAICFGSSVSLTTTGTAVGFAWTPPTALSSTVVPSPLATPTITTKYYITGTGSNGCLNRDSGTVTVNSLPLVNTSADTSVCENGSIQLNTTGAVSYSWTPGTGLSSTSIGNPVASPSIATKYYVTGISASGCANTDSVLISIKSAPTVFTTADTTICDLTSIQLNTTGALNYTWSPVTGLSNPTIANPVATPISTTEYFVTGTAANGCTATDSVTIALDPAPNVIASPDTMICGTIGIHLNATGASGYSWFPATGLNNPFIANPVASPTNSIQYIVTGTNLIGCSATDTVNIAIGFNGKNGLLLPGAFTPNNDGVNDCFGIKFFEGITELEFRIFNRLGENVFYTTNPAVCWNGRFRGKINPGNYVYYIKAKTGCTEPLKINGNVLLIR